ncbi:hypothetical protein LX36DRAFT_429828 [Colletotrichum falcatum]|nr:hypothetical protein LX36DRAFT_429828 [Colletotrichum falcatum]
MDAPPPPPPPFISLVLFRPRAVFPHRDLLQTARPPSAVSITHPSPPLPSPLIPSHPIPSLPPGSSSSPSPAGNAETSAGFFSRRVAILPPLPLRPTAKGDRKRIRTPKGLKKTGGKCSRTLGCFRPSSV